MDKSVYEVPSYKEIRLVQEQYILIGASGEAPSASTKNITYDETL